MHKYITLSLALFISTSLHAASHDLNDDFALGLLCGLPLPVVGLIYASKKLYMLDNADIIPNDPNKRAAAYARAQNTDQKKAFYRAMFLSSTMSTIILYETLNNYVPVSTNNDENDSNM